MRQSSAPDPANRELARSREWRWLEMPSKVALHPNRYYFRGSQNGRTHPPGWQRRPLPCDKEITGPGGARLERIRIRNHDRTVLLLKKHLFAGHWSPLFEH